MNNPDFSQIQTLDQIRNWNMNVRDSLELYKKEIYNNFRKSNTSIPAEFIGITENELRLKFEVYFKELSYSVCLNLVACIEANIQNDFKFRLIKRKKDTISKELRAVSIKEQTNEIGLQKILNVWKKNKPELKRLINQYESILEFRHWLAHGRHWVFKSKIYEEDLVYKQGIEILKSMEINF